MTCRILSSVNNLAALPVWRIRFGLVFVVLLLAASPVALGQDPVSGVQDSEPSMPVSTFVVMGLNEYPEYGITAEAVNKLVEQKRLHYQGLFTLERLREVTQAITRYYRQAGFLLARAYIPEQTVENGIVRIQVLEGRLEAIQSEGYGVYKPAQLQQLFTDLIGRPVHVAQIETRLLYLNDFPGLSTFSVFRPGNQPGTAVLMLSAERERRYHAGLSLDNHGSSFTGKYRALFNFALNNPTWRADRLELTLLQSLLPLNSTYGALNYRLPFGQPGQYFGVGYSKNTFQVGDYLAELEIAGNSFIGNAYFNKALLRTPGRNSDITLDLSRKSARNRQADQSIGRDELTVITLSGNYSAQDRRFAGDHGIRLAISRGIAGLLGAMDSNGNGRSSRIGADGERAGGNFTKFSLQAHRRQSLDTYVNLKNQALLLKAKLQYSRDLLTSLEQILLGGPNGVRGYPISQAQMDSGYVISIEWLAQTANMPSSSWLARVQLSGFVDHARGWRNQPLANELRRASLLGAGLALSATLQRHFDARLDIAAPLAGDEVNGGAAFQAFFKLNYHF